ncbi:unnamed protein product [Sphenostylis stenocarpa]|uniref:Uncharacterized protein n=1 Tax=Sphenostylis stenocarpa TaxID=92480 RepID=A0AA86SK01_9FABA|nr:unnamed protein product [Sphenostylis stenocarpa]
MGDKAGGGAGGLGRDSVGWRLDGRRRGGSRWLYIGAWRGGNHGRERDAEKTATRVAHGEVAVEVEVAVTPDFGRRPEMSGYGSSERDGAQMGG